MKAAQCKYTKAGTDITLNVYFDNKAFELITPLPSKQQEEHFIRLTCDSIAATLSHEQTKKNFYIKRMIQSDEHHYLLFCTDGLLMDDALSVIISQQAYANERITITDINQLPAQFKLNNDLINKINSRLPLFENEARKKITLEKIAMPKEAAKKNSPEIMMRELPQDKATDVLSDILLAKKEIKNLTETTIKSLQEEIAKPSTKASSENMIHKLKEITPVYEKFSTEANEISERITKKMETLTLFKRIVIQSLYDAAQQFSDLILQKNRDAALPLKNALRLDFNRKFSGIATLSEENTLNNLNDTEKNLEKLSLESLQEIISNDQKDHPGLLQKCNTSWTEESPELKIVMKQLSQLNEKLAVIFKQDAEYAHQEMTQITRIPVPRSFQFKFSNSALQYKKVVDDFCKSQKENLLRLVNQYKKMLQINNLDYQPTTTPVEKPSTDLQKIKEGSIEILNMGNHNHALIKKYISTSKQLFDFLNANIDENSPSLTNNIKSSADKIEADIRDANTILHQMVDHKSQIDIAINHYVLHPKEQPDLPELDQKNQELKRSLNQLLAKSKMIKEEINRLNAYANIIKRIKEIDLSATQSSLISQRNEAKESLLQVLQKQNIDPLTTEKLKKIMLEQYNKVDKNTSLIDKIMIELTDIKNEILTDLSDTPDPSTENLEMKFQLISEKMQALASAMNTMAEEVSRLKKLSSSS